MSRVAVIGGGAAGMFSSVFAAQNGNEVHLFEKNEKLGKKLFITGKGRCNVTNAADIETLFSNVRANPKFLYSAFYGYSNEMVMDFFEKNGCPLKVERGDRVFPVSDHSSDVIAALERAMRKAGVSIHLNHEIHSLDELAEFDSVIVATGGYSYQSTGSTGDGYRFAKEKGLTVTEICPGLVPMNVEGEIPKMLQGLSLKNVTAAIYDGKKELYKDFGEMLFTHFGVSGPLILTGSSYISKQIKERPLRLVIDLKPALTKEQLDARILREFEEGSRKQFKNVLGSLFPSKLIPVMIEQSGIAPDKKVNEISKAERQHFADLIKGFELTVTSLRGWNEAIITRGGVSVKEINPSTMECRKIPGLYFAGEVLDLDAKTGGFNLQIAWSTAYLAGMNA
ncbi:MAG: NAD(P)/FAD-dependent oxidoreductase [Lachnospiraceae bacterium]